MRGDGPRDGWTDGRKEGQVGTWKGWWGGGTGEGPPKDAVSQRCVGGRLGLRGGGARAQGLGGGARTWRWRGALRASGASMRGSYSPRATISPGNKAKPPLLSRTPKAATGPQSPWRHSHGPLRLPEQCWPFIQDGWEAFLLFFQLAAYRVSNTGYLTERSNQSFFSQRRQPGAWGRMQAQESLRITTYLFFNPGQPLWAADTSLLNEGGILCPAAYFIHSMECHGIRDAEPPHTTAPYSPKALQEALLLTLPRWFRTLPWEADHQEIVYSINTEPSIKRSLGTSTDFF